MWGYCMLFETLRKTLSKKRPWHRCFPVNFVKFLRTPCIREHTWWLLLTVKNYSKSKSKNQSKTLRKKCPYSKLFWSAFFPQFPALGLNTGIAPYSVRMPENAGKMLTRITSNTDTFYTVKSLIWKSIQQNFYFGSVIFDLFFF